MDLSYLRFDHDASVAVSLPPDLAVLLVGVTARQAASPTATAQARMAPDIADGSPFHPVSGSFHPIVAQRFIAWQEE